MVGAEVQKQFSCSQQVPLMAVVIRFGYGQRAFELVPEPILAAPRVRLGSRKVLKPSLLHTITVFEFAILELLLDRKLFIGAVLEGGFRCGKFSVTSGARPHITCGNLYVRAEAVGRRIPNLQLL